MPPDELSIIDRYFRPLAGEGGFGLLDDAARLDVPPDCDLVVTTDMIAGGVHFLPGDPPEMVAKKALRVNVSDLAAKGSEPLAYVISIGITEEIGEAWLESFASGLKEDQELFGIRLIGGDTIFVREAPVVSITAFGIAPKDRMVHRFGGHPGEVLFASGTIGAGTTGLALAKGEPGPWDALPAAQKEALIQRFRVPEPRTALAASLVQFATAAMDISDGLVGDCDKLVAACGCSATIEAERVPLPDGLGPDIDDAALARLVTGGDDYEILAVVPPAKAAAFEVAARAAGVPVSRIGALTEGRGRSRVLRRGEELRLTARAWVHGRSEERP